MFAYGVGKAGADRHYGVFLVTKGACHGAWAPAKGMGIGMLFMHNYQVLSRSKLRRWPFEVISWWERRTQTVASCKARNGYAVGDRLPLDIL